MIDRKVPSSRFERYIPCAVRLNIALDRTRLSWEEGEEIMGGKEGEGAMIIKVNVINHMQMVLE